MSHLYVYADRRRKISSGTALNQYLRAISDPNTDMEEDSARGREEKEVERSGGTEGEGEGSGRYIQGGREGTKGRGREEERLRIYNLTEETRLATKPHSSHANPSQRSRLSSLRRHLDNTYEYAKV